MKEPILSAAALCNILEKRDLTDPSQGAHAIQSMVRDVVEALQNSWGCPVYDYRDGPIVSVQDNYDRLRYPKDGLARGLRYTRYVSDTELLRTSTTAMVPKAMRALAQDRPEDVLLSCKGLVYRRDCIDRLHLGEIHQIDLWRVCSSRAMGDQDLREMVKIVLSAALPGLSYRLEDRVHPYTLNGLQMDVLYDGKWVEVGECGLAHPEILSENIPDHPGLSGLAMGLGLDRLLMVRKKMKDIRLVASSNPKIYAQMLDLSPYREVSSMPPIERDLSVVLDSLDTVEDLGDKVREVLGLRAAMVEAVEVLSQTSFEDLPASAVARLGILEGQKNVLIRITFRDLDRTLTHEECNLYRDQIYKVLHKGKVWQWACPQEV